MTRPDRERQGARQRERRVVMGGGAVVAAALLLAYGIVPFVRQWRAREASIAVARERVSYLATLTARTASLEAAAATDERALSTRTRRVMHARSSTLAASALQSLLQDMADASPLVVTRLEVSADDSSGVDPSVSFTDPSGAGQFAAGQSVAGASGHRVLQVPATMSAYGDIAGVSTLLHLISTGPRVLQLERLAMQRNAALLGAPDVVQVTMTIRAPVLPE